MTAPMLKGVERWRLAGSHAQTAHATRVQVDCRHNSATRRRGGCPGCMARYWMVTSEVAELLKTGKPTDALQLLADFNLAMRDEGQP